MAVCVEAVKFCKGTDARVMERRHQSNVVCSAKLQTDGGFDLFYISVHFTSDTVGR